MLDNFKNLADLLDHFKEQQSCIDQLEKWRWNDKVSCPHCGHEKVYRLREGFKCANSECYKKFSVLVGSIFENTKVSLRLWFAAIYLCTTHKKGVSSLQLSRDIRVTQKTAWFMLHRIRKMFSIDKVEQELEGTVQLDETFCGGKNKNRHHDKKVPQSQGRSFKDKTPVMGMLQQEESKIVERPNKNDPSKVVKEKVVLKPSFVKLHVVPDTKGKSIRPIIRVSVKKGSVVVSDEWIAYSGLNNMYDHRVVDHGRKQYVNENGDTTNAMEGFWSTFKKGLIGVYQCVSRKHLHRYCAEFAFRYNNRYLSNVDKFLLAMGNCSVRLTYMQLKS